MNLENIECVLLVLESLKFCFNKSLTNDSISRRGYPNKIRLKQLQKYKFINNNFLSSRIGRIIILGMNSDTSQLINSAGTDEQIDGH